MPLSAIISVPSPVIEPVHTSLFSNIPSDWTVGEEYSQSSAEDLLNSDQDQGTFGEKLGSRNS